jgi:hypothetical protein
LRVGSFIRGPLLLAGPETAIDAKRKNHPSENEKGKETACEWKDHGEKFIAVVKTIS